MFSSIYAWVGAAVAAVTAIIAIYTKGRADAKARAKTQRLQEHAAAQEAQAEMHRDASRVEIETGAKTRAALERELGEWSS